MPHQKQALTASHIWICKRVASNHWNTCKLEKQRGTATKVLFQQQQLIDPMTWPILATKKANRSHTSQITWRTQQYWCVHRPASEEVRHLEEKSSRGFRFLRHRHKTRTLRHQWTQVPNNCDKHAVIPVPMMKIQKQTSDFIHSGPSQTNIWWITTNNDEVTETNIWLHQRCDNDEASDTDIRLHQQVIHLRNKHLMDHKQMMPQKRPSDIIHPAGPDNTWQQPHGSSGQPDFTNNCHPTNTYLTNKHTSESLTPFKRQHCQLMSP